MVESRCLRLALTSRRLNQMLLSRISTRLIAMGYAGATPATLDFLGALDCGDNHASEIARMMGVSRQWVARNVGQFCRLGYLEQRAGPGRGKRIVFTARGEDLMADARRELAALDRILEQQFGEAAIERLVAITEEVTETIADLR